MQKMTTALVLALVLMSGASVPLFAAQDTWSDVADEMRAMLDRSYDGYVAGDMDGAKDAVDEAYFDLYEKLGFEKNVKAYISGNRVAAVEHEFDSVKKAMSAGEPKAEVRKALDKLIVLLREDADRLDGKQESPVAVFLAALLIILREGFEAILIVGAIAAYLVKSGNKHRTKTVYWGALAALIASVLLSAIFNALSGLDGEDQELVEGATMLVAVAVLFYVSNWMISKADTAAWSSYIEKRVENSISRRSMYSLAFAAFLAVFREGTETILFYQALVGDTKTHPLMIWVGLGAGSLLLVIIYLLFRFLSVRLPLKPFFIGTSLLLFVMAISFAGSGIKELQEANAVSITPVGAFSSAEALGIYPTAETLGAQLFLLALTIATVIVAARRRNAKRGGAAEVRP
jgi:high-affinity iron transporter